MLAHDLEDCSRVNEYHPITNRKMRTIAIEFLIIKKYLTVLTVVKKNYV